MSIVCVYNEFIYTMERLGDGVVIYVMKEEELWQICCGINGDGELFEYIDDKFQKRSNLENKLSHLVLNVKTGIVNSHKLSTFAVSIFDLLIDKISDNNSISWLPKDTKKNIFFLNSKSRTLTLPHNDKYTKIKMPKNIKDLGKMDEFLTNKYLTL